MNLQEFMDWRKDCFVCGTELELTIHEPSIRVKRFSLIEDRFVARISYYDFSIKRNENIIVNDGTSSDILLKFLKKGIDIRMICPQSSHYDYQTNISVADDLTFTIPYVGEIVKTEKFHMKQRSDCVCEVHFKSAFAKPPRMLTLPYLDLNKTTFNKLQDKIKTHIVFS